MARCAGALPDRAAPFRASRLLAPPPLPDVERREPRPAAAPPPDDHRSRAPSKRSPGRRARFSYIDVVAAAPKTLAVELAVLAYRLGHLDTAHDRFRVKVARPTERAIQQWRHLPVRGLQKSKQLLRREWGLPRLQPPPPAVTYPLPRSKKSRGGPPKGHRRRRQEDRFPNMAH